MKNKFCRSLSNNVTFRISDNGKDFTVNPCCYYVDGNIFTTDTYTSIRNKFINATDYLEGCTVCKTQENGGYRLYNNLQIPLLNDNRVYKLDLIIDTTCNAACIHCRPEQSSLWRKQIQENKKVFHIQPEHEISHMIEQIKSQVDINEVKHFHFWGGEPLLTNTHLNFLTDVKNKADVELSYTTNCSIVPGRDIIEFWKQFKKITIYLSIDGIGKKFNYIRWPLSWNKIEENLNLFREIELDNLYYHFNHAVIPLNVFYIDEFIAWKNKNFNHYQKKPVTYRFLHGHGILKISNTPERLREQVYKKFGNNHRISQLLQSYPVTDHAEMINYLSTWDNIRMQNWKETFNEIVQYYEDYM